MILNDNPKVRDWLGEHPDNVIVVHCKVTLMMVANKEFDYKQNIARIAKAALCSRVSQKNQKSKFWYATNPSGVHRLDEPPEKNSAL